MEPIELVNKYAQLAEDLETTLESAKLEFDDPKAPSLNEALDSLALAKTLINSNNATEAVKHIDHAIDQVTKFGKKIYNDILLLTANDSQRSSKQNISIRKL